MDKLQNQRGFALVQVSILLTVVVILSAGPDQEIDSQFYMDGFEPGDE